MSFLASFDSPTVYNATIMTTNLTKITKPMMRKRRPHSVDEDLSD